MKQSKMICGLIFAFAAVLGLSVYSKVHAESSETEIFIDGKSASLAGNTLRNGLGAISGNNSSALLIDYKENHPEQYNEIMKLLFKKNYGAGLTHVKVEMGSDVNSSSGTEPSIMRSPGETPDITRGAGWQFAADAKKINPDITIDMLRWSEPRWVTEAFEESAEAGYTARYKWYKAHLDAAYDTYGLTVDCVSADANETDNIDSDWIIFLSEKLKAEKNGRYDYSKIKIVASDEIGTWDIAREMISDQRLRDAVDIVSCHYNTYGSEDTNTLLNEYGKQIWYSEGAAPMNVSEYSGIRGLKGVNGPLDIANRIINMYCRGRMTMYEFQPAAAAYYSGTKYFPKGLITANTPWNGSYTCEDGLYIAAHFTRFTEKGWSFVNSACFGDGEENHSITNTTNNYLTLTDSEKKNYTVIITNDSDTDRTYKFTLMNMSDPSHKLHVWESCGEYLFQRQDDISPKKSGNNYSFRYTVKAGSIVTLTTVEGEMSVNDENIPENTVLALPYSESFDYPDEFLASRGNAPLYMCVQGGAFEVIGGKLRQLITNDNKPFDWRYKNTPLPTVSFGDDRWSDYAASADVKLANSKSDNFAGIGIRYNSAVTDEDTAVSGYNLLVFGDGHWELSKAYSLLESGSIKKFSAENTYTLRIEAVGRNITAAINGETMCSITESGGFTNSGRISLRSAYYENTFDNLYSEALSDTPYITRTDALDKRFAYAGSFLKDPMSSYTFYNRTRAVSDTQTRLIPAADFIVSKGISLSEDGSLHADSDGAAAVIEFEENEITVHGYALDSAKLFLDGKPLENKSPGNMLKISADNGNSSHSLRIMCGKDAVLDYAVCGGQPKNSYFSLKYTGGGIALIGENHSPAAIDVIIDGTPADSFTYIPETLSREAYYSCGLPYGEHEISVRVKYGCVVTDAAEIKVKSGSAEKNPYDHEITENIPSSETVSAETGILSENAVPADESLPEKDHDAAAERSFNAVPVLLGIAAASAAFIIVRKTKKNGESK